jgi:histidyl-tRNA synthetase
VDVTGGEAARDLTAELRRAGLAAGRAYDGRSLKAQLKQADRSGARYALIVGPDELERGLVTVRPLRATGPQESVARESVVAWLGAASASAAESAAAASSEVATERGAGSER